MTDLETILSWFQTGDMPTEEEFRQTLSSFRHKNTKISIAEVDGLESSLNNKVNVGDIIGGGENSIPLKGTEPDKPVSGHIQMSYQAVEPTIYMGDREGAYRGVKFDWDDQIVLTNWESYYYHSDVTINRSGINMSSVDINNNQHTSFSISTDGMYLGTNGKTFSFNENGLLVDNLVNAQGDPTFTRQLVQKENGSIGWEAKPETVIVDISDIATGNVFYERHGNYAFVTIDCNFNSLQVDQSLLIPVDGIFKTSYRVFQAFREYSTYAPVDIVMITSNSGINLINKNNSAVPYFSIRQTFVLECGYDPGAS